MTAEAWIENHCQHKQLSWAHSLRRHLDTLGRKGIVSFPFLMPHMRRSMLEEARELQYDILPKETPSGVRQEINSCCNLPLSSFLLLCARNYAVVLEERIKRLMDWDEYPFNTAFSPNETVVQRYQKGTLGITPHVDGGSHRNIVSNFVLGGKGELWVCDNHVGDNPVRVSTTPGNLVLMRANGFLKHTNTPFHFIKNIKSDLHMLGVMQKTK